MIRPAAHEDFEQICDLFRALDEFHVAILPDIFQGFDGPARPTQILERKITSDDAALFVAELGDKLVGFVDIQVVASPDVPMFKPRKFALIDNIYVEPTVRGSGLAARLFEYACGWAKNRGLQQVRLKVYEANEGAVQFYERKMKMQRVDATFEMNL